MKVGTDGVALGAWVPVDGVRRILDIGTGTGLIALMLAQRSSPDCQIVAVELDHDAAGQAAENVANSRWSRSGSRWWSLRYRRYRPNRLD